MISSAKRLTVLLAIVLIASSLLFCFIPAFADGDGSSTLTTGAEDGDQEFLTTGEESSVVTTGNEETETYAYERSPLERTLKMILGGVGLVAITVVLVLAIRLKKPLDSKSPKPSPKEDEQASK